MSNNYQSILPDEALTLTDMCDVIHDWAKKKGWWDSERNKGELIALMHSELSEALEFLRKPGCEPCPNCPSRITAFEQEYEGRFVWGCSMCGCQFPGRNPKLVPQMDDKVPSLTGEEAELADCVIRIMDYCGHYGINLGEAIRIKHEFNISRPHKHGGKHF